MKKQNEIIDILVHAFGFEQNPARLKNLIAEHKAVPCGNLIEQLKLKLNFIKKENQIVETLLAALVSETNVTKLNQLINKYIEIDVFSIQRLISSLISKKKQLTPNGNDDAPPAPPTGFSYKP